MKPALWKGPLGYSAPCSPSPWPSGSLCHHPGRGGSSEPGPPGGNGQMEGSLGKTSHYMGHASLSSIWLPCQLRELKQKVVATLTHLEYNCSRHPEPRLTCREHCLSRMALRLPFQCNSWKTVINSCNGKRQSGCEQMWG